MKDMIQKFQKLPTPKPRKELNKAAEIGKPNTKLKR